jgi:hypothetical protein
LSALERFRCLGFDRILSSPIDSFEDSIPYLKVSGNTFSVPVFEHLLHAICLELKSGKVTCITRSCLGVPSKELALAALGSKQSNLRR